MQLIFDKYDKAIGKISSDFMEDLEEFVEIAESNTGMMANISWTTEGRSFETSELTEVRVVLFGDGIRHDNGFLDKAFDKIETDIASYSSESFKDNARRLLEAFKNTTQFNNNYIMIKIYV